MLHPSYSDLMNVVNSEVEPGEEPVVTSRYSIVMATAKRARQINNGDEIDPFSASLMSALGKEPEQTEPDVDPEEVGDDDAGLLSEADGDF